MSRLNIFLIIVALIWGGLFSNTAFAACGGATHLINEIQGSGNATGLRGEVVTIEGVVVGVYQGDERLRGFFVQEEDSDNDSDPTTSEGIFVFDDDFGTAVTKGQLVAITGEVDEFQGMTQIDTITEVADCGTDSVTAADISLPVASLDDWEQYEGMLVHFSQELVVSEVFLWGRFGQVTLASERLFIPTHIANPGDEAELVQELNLRSQVVLDDGSTSARPGPLPPQLGEDDTIRVGDTITGLTGVINYSFDVFRVHASTSENFVRSNPREAVPQSVNGSLKVASFNVLNYFSTLDKGNSACGPTGSLDCRGANSDAEFNRQTAKVVAALAAMDADIVGLMEVQNDDGAALNHLLTELNSALGGDIYQAIETGHIGTDAIKVAFIYKPSTVMPIGEFAILDSSVDIEFIDNSNRPSLIQTFEEVSTGGRLTIAVNHLKSKGSNCSRNRFDGTRDIDFGDGQGNCNLTRTKATQALINWLTTDPTGSGDPDFLLIGDFNAYRLEDPISAMREAGYTDLMDAFGSDSAYSYVFRGQSGYLDHALSNKALTPQVAGLVEWHINADEPPAKDYNDDISDAGEGNNELNQAGLYSPDAFRSSDHDPLIVGLNLEGSLTTASSETSSSSGTKSGTTPSSGIPMWYLILAALMAAALILSVLNRP